MHIIVSLGGNSLLEESLAVVLLQKQSLFLTLKWAFSQFFESRILCLNIHYMSQVTLLTLHLYPAAGSHTSLVLH